MLYTRIQNTNVYIRENRKIHFRCQTITQSPNHRAHPLHVKDRQLELGYGRGSKSHPSNRQADEPLPTGACRKQPKTQDGGVPRPRTRTRASSTRTAPHRPPTDRAPPSGRPDKQTSDVTSHRTGYVPMLSVLGPATPRYPRPRPRPPNRVTMIPRLATPCHVRANRAHLSPCGTLRSATHDGARLPFGRRESLRFFTSARGAWRNGA